MVTLWSNSYPNGLQFSSSVNSRNIVQVWDNGAVVAVMSATKFARCKRRISTVNVVYRNGVSGIWTESISTAYYSNITL